MIGYKAFNKDWTCRGLQYEIGKTYEMKESPLLCNRGFHFCTELLDCFEYYPYRWGETRVALVEALGETVTYSENLPSILKDSKHVTNKIRIIEEIHWNRIEKAVNKRNDEKGYKNFGESNNGNENIGDYNGGSYNVGRFNVGMDNVGRYNIGMDNVGHDNEGNGNVGNYNRGSNNLGNYNIGDNNWGDWNCASNAVGVFCTKPEEEYIRFFNKPSKMTHFQWRYSEAHRLLTGMEGYPHETHQDWWKSLDVKQKEVILSLPNFDPAIFTTITSIELDEFDLQLLSEIKSEKE